jgi:hypothetical protein
LPLILKFAFECATRKVQENHEGLDLNGICQFLVYDDDVNTLSENINTIIKNREAVLEASKKIGLEVYIQKSKRMVHQSSSIWEQQ